MNKTWLLAFVAVLFTLSFSPHLTQNAFAAVDSVIINEPTAATSFGANFSIDYTVGDNLGNTATAGSITFTRTGGTADAGAHVYTMSVPGDTSTGAHSITRATLEGDAGFDVLVDGSEYTIVVSITDGATTTDTELVVTADFTAPSFTAAKTAGNQITLTWSENVDSALDTATAGNPFTLGGTALTVASTSNLNGAGNTQVLTLSGNIPDGSTITVSYDKDAGNGDILDTADTDPNEAPDINNVSLSGIPDAPITGGGGGCDDCVPPTLGVDKNNFRLVEDGLRYNKQSVDVEYFYTPFNLVLTTVGSENIAELKIYENSGSQSIQHIGLSFGLDTGEIFSDALATIEWDKVYGDEPKVTVTDPENILESVRIVVDPNLVKCKEDSFANECMVFRIYHTFREGPEFNMFSTYIWDEKRNGWQNYFNHGINVVGESLNPPDQHTVFDRQGFLYTITEVDTTHAIDGNGDEWYLDDDSFWKKKFFVKRSVTNETPLAGYDRNHPYFTAYQNGQIILAERTIKAILGVDSIQSVLPDYIPGPIASDNTDDDVELTNKMKLEEIRAFERMYKEYYEIHPYGKQFPFSEPEIPEGFSGIATFSEPAPQEQVMVIALMVGIVAVSVGTGFYSMRKK